jgi:hypothetical protein
MKHLYSAETNAMTMYFVEDFDTNKAICVDWDLSQSEVDELITAFESGKLDETANGGKWGDPDEVYGDTFCKKRLAVF